MKQLLVAGLVVVSALVACRTNIAPVKKQQENEVYIPPGGCNVRRYPNATDVPEGARNLGWVQVAMMDSDEATYEALDKRVCEAGGDAVSSLHWEKTSTETTAMRMELRANAWSLP